MIDIENSALIHATFVEKLAFSTKEQVEKSSFKWRVTVSGELMFLDSYGNCDVTNTVTLFL